MGEGPAPFRVELGERIRWLLNRYESRPEAAAVAGVTPEHLASYMNGRAKPPFELISRLAQDQKVSLTWIATGEGQRELSEAADGFAAISVAQNDALSGGPGSYPLPDDIREHIAFSRAWLRSAIRAPEDRLRIVFNRGDANEPDIRDGDAMLVITGLEKIIEDGYYVFKTDGPLMTKFVQRYVNGDISVRTNRPQDNQPTLSPDEAVRLVFGQVRWRGGLR